MPAQRRRPVKAALETWLRDFTHAARSLGRAPGFTPIVVATLALAIGVNAAIFSVVNAVLLHPLPFAHADRLVHIASTAPGTDQPEEFGVPDELYVEYRESAPGLEDVGLYGTGSSTTRAEGYVDRALRDPGDAVIFHDVGRAAAARPVAQRSGRQPRCRPQLLALAVLVQVRSRGDWQELHLRSPDPCRDRHHETGVPLSG